MAKPLPAALVWWLVTSGHVGLFQKNVESRARRSQEREICV